MHFLDNKIAPNKPNTSQEHQCQNTVDGRQEAKRYQQPRWDSEEAIHPHTWAPFPRIPPDSPSLGPISGFWLPFEKAAVVVNHFPSPYRGLGGLHRIQFLETKKGKRKPAAERTVFGSFAFVGTDVGRNKKA